MHGSPREKAFILSTNGGILFLLNVTRGNKGSGGGGHQGAARRTILALIFARTVIKIPDGRFPDLTRCVRLLDLHGREVAISAARAGD
jgi:hypothetical protein